MMNKIHISEFVVPFTIPVQCEQESDGRWYAVIEKYPEVTAYGDTRDEAIGHAIELLLTVLDGRVAFIESLANAPIDDEPLTPEDIAAIDEGRRSLERGEGIPHDDILREFGLLK
jgi:predicted RNase H-like HicB family nuclease